MCYQLISERSSFDYQNDPSMDRTRCEGKNYMNYVVKTCGCEDMAVSLALLCLPYLELLTSAVDFQQ